MHLSMADFLSIQLIYSEGNGNIKLNIFLSRKPSLQDFHLDIGA